MTAKVPFIKPRFPTPEELTGYLHRIYENNYYSNNGPIYYEFRAALESYLGQNVKGVAVSNATLGLMLAIKACVEPGKKYIAIPSFTFAAGPLAIRWCGFEPVFFDIDATTLQPSLTSFQELTEVYAEDLAAILLPNSFGIGNSEIDEWERLASEQALPLIIDSAPGFGSEYADGTKVGCRGTCEVFSFHATKPFGIGEGGLITTRDEKLAATCESLKNFGFDGQKETVRQGLNAKITEIDCAIGLCLLKEYPETVHNRRKLYEYFRASLSGHAIDFLPRTETSAIQFVTILTTSQKRQLVLDALKDAGVDARTYYAPAVHTFPAFAGCPTVSLHNTDEVSARVVSLPLHSTMETTTVDYICDIVKRVMDTP